MSLFSVDTLSAATMVWFVVTAGCSVFIIYTDIAFYWIPDHAVVILALCNGAALAAGQVHPDIVITLLVSGFFCILWLIRPDGIGTGDIKLILALCLGCNGWNAYFMMVIAFMTALASGVVLRLVKGQTMLPFGPCLLAGWWTALCLGKELATWLPFT